MEKRLYVGKKSNTRMCVCEGYGTWCVCECVYFFCFWCSLPLQNDSSFEFYVESIIFQISFFSFFFPLKLVLQKLGVCQKVPTIRIYQKQSTCDLWKVKTITKWIDNFHGIFRQRKYCPMIERQLPSNPPPPPKLYFGFHNN